MFERILTVHKHSLLEKFNGTFAGKAATSLATIAEARALVQLLAAASPKYRNGLAMPKPELLAVGGGTGQSEFEVAEMIELGFSTEVPIHLVLRYDFGNGRVEKIEVFDALLAIGKDGEQGYQMIFNDLERSW